MNFIADLHIHSRFSMATSKAITLPHLAAWAATKGINVLGTGDFTHPKWRMEMRDQLELDETSGLYRLKGRLARQSAGNAPEPLFCLQTEISSIYRRAGKVRKVHNLVFMPDLDAADRLAQRLALIGNINSDGRPILGLDSHDLLEMVLECSPRAVLVPAHIWTPWFSLFGSKSGFDRLEDCYADLSGHIFALETGLSSDPAMNRCLSMLDKYALISNSDAHSGANLGREANLFAGKPAYDGIFDALRASATRVDQSALPCRFLGTMEFYPEEGKYHMDGHRACGIVLTPRGSRELGNICPVCGKPLTIGVLHRVMELADREEPGSPPNEPEARMLVPLAEVLSQILGVGANTSRVQRTYADAVARLGPELHILCQLPEADIRSFSEPLGEAVARLRNGAVSLAPGFDGQYGVISIFQPEELADIRGGLKSGNLFGKSPAKASRIARVGKRKLELFGGAQKNTREGTAEFAYSPGQAAAIQCGEDPAFVLAGPGAGKTRVLTGRIASLIGNGAAPESILALTFTRRAAAELKERLINACPGRTPVCDTLHGLAWRLLNETSLDKYTLLGDDTARRLFMAANPGLDVNQGRRLWEEIILAAETGQPLSAAARAAALNYAEIKKRPAALYMDFADLMAWLMENAASLAGRWRHVLVDEAQDLSAAQLEIIRRLLPREGSGFFGIGDPDQSIYEFRGGSGQNLDTLLSIWPKLKVLRLGESYRAGQKILDMAQTVLAENACCGKLTARREIQTELRLFTAQSDTLEARWIAEKIKDLLGSTAHTLVDGQSRQNALAPLDIAILVRLKAQIPVIATALQKAAIPFLAPVMDAFWQDGPCAAFLDELLSHPEISDPQQLLEAFAKNPPQKGGMDPEILKRNPAFTALCSLWKRTGGQQKFFQELAWLKEAELIATRAQTVRIMTLHASKGLEFDTVFIPGLENCLLPFRPGKLFRPDKLHDWESPDPASEARLLYVGITRAAGRVFISHARQRHLFGQTLHLDPSPFLASLSGFCQHSRFVAHGRQHGEALPLLEGTRPSTKARE